jgi:tetratricopeptide (TPR) repeat protein
MDADEGDPGTLDELDCGLAAGFGRASEAAPRMAPSSVLAVLDPAGRLSSHPVQLKDEPGFGPPIVVPRPASEGRYQIAGEIARGGMGLVLKGRDADLGRDVAIKVLRDDHAADPQLLRRFVEEAQIGGQLQHPGIVPVYELGVDASKRPFFAMKLVKGRTLSALLQDRRDPLEERSRFLSIFESVCQTMAYAHARGVIHRDLKPSNIMVGAFGEILVVDWGMAKVLGQGGVVDERRARRANSDDSEVRTVRGTGGTGSDSVAGSVMGTTAYMSPEQARGEVESLDERTDVFGLGALLCEILTGAPPYVGSAVEVLRQAAGGRVDGALERLESSGSDLELIALARVCLSPSPSDRPRNGGAVAGLVAAYLASLEEKRRAAEGEALRATVRAQEERKRRRTTVALAAALLALVGVGGGGAVWLEGQRRDRAEETSRLVGEALAEASTARAKAAATADLAHWAEALSVARRGEALARDRSAEDDVRARATRMSAEVQSEQRRAQDIAQQGEADRRLVARLEEAHHHSWGSEYRAMQARAYRAALDEYGIDLREGADPSRVADGIQASAAATHIIGAIDELATLERLAGHPVRHLESISAAAEGDPWSRRVRAATTLDELRLLANEARLDSTSVHSLLGLVRRICTLGDTALAAEFALRVRAQYPGEFVANMMAASLMPGCRPPRLEEEVRYLTAAIALRPRSAAAYNNLAMVLLRKRDSEGALSAIREVIRIEPDSVTALDFLATLLWDLGKEEDAEAACRAAILRAPDTESAHRALARILLRQGDVKGAETEGREAIRLNPTSAQAHAALGEVLAESRQYGNAEAACRKAIALDVECYEAHFRLSMILHKQEKFQEAVASARCAIGLQPYAAEPFARLGESLRRSGDLTGAEVACRDAIRLDARSLNGYFNLALVLCDKHEFVGAEEICRAAIEIAPESGPAYRQLGWILLKRADIQGAETAARRSIQLMPLDLPAHSSLGVILQKKGDLEGALASFRRTTALGSDAMAHYNLGGTLWRMGEVAEAEAECRRAIELDPALGLAHANLGILLRQTGRFRDAEVALRRGIELMPEDAQGHLDLSHCFSCCGKPQDALTSSERAIALSQPGSDTAKTAAEMAGVMRHLLRLEPRMEAFLAGRDAAADDAEAYGFAILCYHRSAYVASAEQYSRVMTSFRPSKPFPWVLEAAASAALAGTERGSDAALLDEEGRSRWRAQSLAWLRLELDRIRGMASQGRWGAAPDIVRLRAWPDLAGLRDPAEIAKLPLPEQRLLREFWEEVDRVAAKARKAR